MTTGLSSDWLGIHLGGSLRKTIHVLRAPNACTSAPNLWEEECCQWSMGYNPRKRERETARERRASER